MTAMPRGKAGNLSLYVPLIVGRKQRSTGTADKARFKQYKAAVDWLASDRVRAFDVLAELAAGRLSFDDVLGLYSSGIASLGVVRAKLVDVTLADHMDAFVAAWIADGKGVRTLENYRREVTAFLDTHPMRSDWTTKNLTAHLRALDVTSGTRAKHLYAMRSFERYLNDVGVMDTMPAQAVRTPKRNKKRLRYVSAEIDTAVCGAVAPRYRAACALIHATGADVSSVLGMLGRDLDLTRLRCHIPGTKTDGRDRHEAMVEAWAVPFLDVLRTTLPNAPLFVGLTRHKLSWAHKQACAAVAAPDYQLRDARHSVAVRMRKAGATFEAVAQQLGNSVWQCINVYSAFTADDMAAELAAHATEVTTRAARTGLTIHRKGA